MAATIAWAVAPVAAQRSALERLQGVAALHGLLARTLDVRFRADLMTKLVCCLRCLQAELMQCPSLCAKALCNAHAGDSREP